jgi:putative ABC transport system permease protein
MLEHKGIYIGALYLAILCSLLFVTMVMVASNLQTIYDSFTNDNMLADAEFYLDSEVDLNEFESRFDAKFEKSSVVDYETKPGQTLRIFSSNEVLNKHAILQGQDLDNNSILIDKTFSGANKINIGDTMTISGKDYKVAGTMALPNYLYVIRSKEEMINNARTFGVAVISKSNMYDLPGKSDFYAVRFNNRNNIHEQETKLKSYLLSQGVHIVNWQSMQNKSQVSLVKMEIKVLGIMSKVSPGAIIILTSFLISMLLKRMIQRESAVIGTLYASGYRKKELVSHYMMFPSIIAGYGAVIGALLGMFLMKFMLKFMLMVFPMPLQKTEFNWFALVLGIVIPIIIVCPPAYIVISKMLGHTPAELMKGAKLSEKSNFIEKSLNLDRFKFKTKFKIREQVRSLSRTGFLLFGVIIATVLLLYGLTLQSSLDFMLKEGVQSLYNLKYEYVYNDLQRGKPIAGTEQFNAIYVTMKDDRNNNFAIVGALPNSTRLRLKDLHGDKLLPDRVIATKMLAEKFGIKKGDELHVVSDDTMKEYTLKVDVVASSYAGEFLFMPIEDLNEMLKVPADAYIGIWSDEQIAFAKGTIRSTKSIDAIVEGIKNMIKQTGILVYSLTITAFLLGIIIIYIVTSLVIEENRNTISLFKIFGYKKRDVNSLLLDSNLFLVILGYILGVPILLASVAALMNTLSTSLQMSIPARLNPMFMLFGFIIVMLTYEASKSASKKKIAKIPMSEALKAGTE